MGELGRSSRREVSSDSDASQRGERLALQVAAGEHPGLPALARIM